MNVKKQTPVLLGFDLMDVVTGTGHILAQTARGIVDIGKRARGDTDPMVLEKDAGLDTPSQVIYGLLAATAIYLVVRK